MSYINTHNQKQIPTFVQIERKRE